MSEVAPHLGRLFRILVQVLGRTLAECRVSALLFFCPHSPLPKFLAEYKKGVFHV